MLEIVLELADNGIVKTISDDNINGASAPFQSIKVYDLENDPENSFYKTITFLSELIDDLGLDVGNSYAKEMLTLDIDWGDKYEPTIDELKQKLKDLKEQSTFIKQLIKQIEEKE
jgi:hypothetical protein